jgi:HAD superfamily hydrolase (TIGR01549 family)
VLEAVLFDWGDTLMQFAYSPELVAAGHRAGLAAIGRDGLPAEDALTERFREHYEPLFWAPGTIEEIEYPQLVRRLLGDFGFELNDVKLGLVSNAFDPGWLLHRDLEQMGLAQRLDFSVFSSEVGKRKPHPAIFEHALAVLGVEPTRALFVGDRLYEDVRGAAEVGMTTVQALWFRADEHPEGAEPDHRAFTQLDVLNVVRRLTAG